MLAGALIATHSKQKWFAKTQQGIGSLNWFKYLSIQIFGKSGGDAGIGITLVSCFVL